MQNDYNISDISYFSILWKLIATVFCLVANILQNAFFCAQHIGLELSFYLDFYLIF